MTRTFVVVYFLHKATNSIYYHIKDRPSVPKIHNKYLGFGGEVEPQDKDLYDTCVREIKEELGLVLTREDFVDIGVMHEKDVDRTIHFYKVDLEQRLEEGYIENEGHTKYMPQDYHETNPRDFPTGDPILLDVIVNNKEYTQVEVKDSIARVLP